MLLSGGRRNQRCIPRIVDRGAVDAIRSAAPMSTRSKGGSMRSRKAMAIGVISVLGLSGCAAMNERRWSYCAVAGGLIGAAAGAGTAGGLVNAYGEGNEGQASDAETGAAAGGGALVGGLIGTMLGH